MPGLSLSLVSGGWVGYMPYADPEKKRDSYRAREYQRQRSEANGVVGIEGAALVRSAPSCVRPDRGAAAACGRRMRLWPLLRKSAAAYTDAVVEAI